MKPILFSWCCMMTFAMETNGQSPNSQQLFWVVESNIHYRDCTIVRFYNHENEPVYEVKLMGVSIDIQRPRQKRKLDQLLNELGSLMIVNSEQPDPKTYDFVLNRNFIKKRQVSVQLQQIDRDLL